jgi:hypothetical protein
VKFNNQAVPIRSFDDVQTLPQVNDTSYIFFKWHSSSTALRFVMISLQFFSFQSCRRVSNTQVSQILCLSPNERVGNFSLSAQSIHVIEGAGATNS